MGRTEAMLNRVVDSVLCESDQKIVVVGANATHCRELQRQTTRILTESGFQPVCGPMRIRCCSSEIIFLSAFSEMLRNDRVLGVEGPVYWDHHVRDTHSLSTGWEGHNNEREKHMEEPRLASIVQTFTDGSVHVIEGAEAAGLGKDESKPTGTFQHMLEWNPNYKGFVSPASLGHVIGPANAQQANQSPFGDGAYVIPKHAFLAKTLVTDILYCWGYNEKGVKVFMKVPQKGRSVDGSKVERLMSTG